jgi:hypothetical protein
MDEFGQASPFADVTQSGIDYAAMNKGITPVFFIEPVPDEKATEAAGAVRMREQEMVRIHVAGDMLNVHCSPVLDEHKERFAVQYEAWKTKRQARHIEGTPLKNWPMISPLRIAEFEAMGIFSVENLRDTSDNNIQKLAEGRVWREKAKGWLESAEKNGASAKFAAENERLRSDMEEMRRQIAELSAQVGKEPTERRKPGRPRKEHVEDAA